MPCTALCMESQDPPYADLLQRLANTSNSNEARLKLLERRFTGELPSPRSLTFDGQHSKQCSPDDDALSHAQQQHVQKRGVSPSDQSSFRSPERPGKKRRTSPSDQQDHHRQVLQTGGSSPLRQVTNQQRHRSSPVAKRDLQKRPSPALTSPLSNRLLQKNTISKYFPSRGDNSLDSLPSISEGTQTHVSFEEQEQTMHNTLLAAFKAAEQAQ